MSKIRAKLIGLSDHLITLIESVSSVEFQAKSNEEKALILENAKTINKAAETIVKLAAVETRNRELDLIEKKQPIKIQIGNDSKNISND